MSNFAFNNPAFKQQDPRNVATYPGGPQAAQGAQNASFQHATMDAAANAQLEGMYAAPPMAPSRPTGCPSRTPSGRPCGLFAILLVTAAVGWVWTLGGVQMNPYGGVSMLPWIIGALGGFVLAMVITFTSRKKVRPALIFAYAAFEGLFVGGISAFFEVIYPGIVFQATLATVSVVGVTLALFASGKIRASKKATKVFMIAMVGYLVFSLLNLVLMWTGVLPEGQAFGLLSASIMRHPARPHHRCARRHHGRVLAGARLRPDPAGRPQRRSASVRLDGCLRHHGHGRLAVRRDPAHHRDRPQQLITSAR